MKIWVIRNNSSLSLLYFEHIIKSCILYSYIIYKNPYIYIYYTIYSTSIRIPYNHVKFSVPVGRIAFAKVSYVQFYHMECERWTGQNHWASTTAQAHILRLRAQMLEPPRNNRTIWAYRSKSLSRPSLRVVLFPWPCLASLPLYPRTELLKISSELAWGARQYGERIYCETKHSPKTYR